MVSNVRVKAYEAKTEKIGMALSLIFLGVLIIPFARPISSSTENIFQIVSTAIWIAFACDYVYKFTIAENRSLFVRNHVFELLVVLVPAFRPFRLIRLFPVVGYFLRYSQRSLSGKLLQYVSLAAVLITFPAAIVMYQVEKSVEGSNIKSLGDAIWWAVTTATTVGYGDKFPVSAAGRVLSVLVMVVGISLVGVITASVASWFVKADETKADESQIGLLKKELEEIKLEIKKLNS